MTALQALDECVEWTGHITKYGYGIQYVAGRHVLAHRHAYAMNVGPIPKGMCVCHHCDNRRCVEPSHLFLGSIQDNTADMVSKRRQARGERHSQAKLTNAKVAAIRREASSCGVTQQSIARKYNVSAGTVSMIVNRKIWNDYDSVPAS